MPFICPVLSNRAGDGACFWRGESVYYIGANGAGKSTLLKSVPGLNKTSRGGSVYNDRDIAGAAADILNDPKVKLNYLAAKKRP
ncbi:MAG: ATP-binding cassette domain-containing protein [Desulfobacterales bacterium]